MNTTNNLTTFANEINKVLVGLDLASKEIQLSLADSEGIEHDFKLTPKNFFKFITEHANQNYVFAMEAVAAQTTGQLLYKDLVLRYISFLQNPVEIITAVRIRMTEVMLVGSEMRC